MSLPLSLPHRLGVVLLSALLVLACGDDEPRPQTPSDLTPPTTRAAPEGGEFTASVAVSLACEDGGSGCAAIHYTLDGGTPSLNSPVYQEPLVLTATTLVRFIAVDRAGNVSRVMSAQYTRVVPVQDGTAPTTAATPAGGL